MSIYNYKESIDRNRKVIPYFTTNFSFNSMTAHLPRHVTSSHFEMNGGGGDTHLIFDSDEIEDVIWDDNQLLNFSFHYTITYNGPPPGPPSSFQFYIRIMKVQTPLANPPAVTPLIFSDINLGKFGTIYQPLGAANLNHWPVLDLDSNVTAGLHAVSGYGSMRWTARQAPGGPVYLIFNGHAQSCSTDTIDNIQTLVSDVYGSLDTTLEQYPYQVYIGWNAAHDGGEIKIDWYAW